MYAKILKDKRHKNVVLLSYHEVTAPRFSNWSLKYVLQEAQVIEFFQQHQWEKFNPYALGDDLIEPFLNILDAHNESTPGEKEVVLGPETVKGSIINYKYAIFIGIAVLVLIVGLYFLTTFSTSNSIYGMPVQ